MDNLFTKISNLKPQIEYIYFDLGGVVFNFSGGLQKIAQELNKPLDQVVAYWRLHDDSICKGQLSPQTFWENTTEHFQVSIGKMDFLKFWIQNFKPIQSTHITIKKLHKQKRKIGIITNIYPEVFDKIYAQGIIPKIPYHQIIQSCDQKKIKPDPQIFQYAVHQAKTPPEKIAFVDDREENIQIAKKMHMQPILFKQ